MKKIFLFLPILLTANFVFASIPYDANFVEKNLIPSIQTQIKQRDLTKEDTVSAYKKIIDFAQKQINEISSGATASNTACQKISQSLWEGESLKTGRYIKEWDNIDRDIITLNTFLKSRPEVAGGSYMSSLYEANPNGYSAWTTQSVKNFQKVYGIKQTGSVGPLTLAKINSMICGDGSVVSQSLLPITFTPDSNISIVSNNMTFSLGWKLSPEVLNKAYDMSKLYVILELVDSQNKVVTSIGDGWLQNSRPSNYPLLHSWDKLPTGNVRIKARLSYQPTNFTCDPNIKGDCVPVYSEKNKSLIAYTNSLPVSYTNAIHFME